MNALETSDREKQSEPVKKKVNMVYLDGDTKNTAFDLALIALMRNPGYQALWVAPSAKHANASIYDMAAFLEPLVAYHWMPNSSNIWCLRLLNKSSLTFLGVGDRIRSYQPDLIFVENWMDIPVWDLGLCKSRLHRAPLSIQILGERDKSLLY